MPRRRDARFLCAIVRGEKAGPPVRVCCLVTKEKRGENDQLSKLTFWTAKTSPSLRNLPGPVWDERAGLTAP